MLDAKTIQKYKSWKLSKLLKEVERLVNAFVRKRDSLYNGQYFKCISCDNVKQMSQCNAGHYFSVGNYGAVRFNLDNIHAQCIHCNFRLHGNLIPYRENLIKKIGIERFEHLEMLAHSNFKYDRLVLIDIIEKFKNSA